MHQLTLALLAVFLSLPQQSFTQDDSSKSRLGVKPVPTSLVRFAVPPAWNPSFARDRYGALVPDSSKVQKPSLSFTTPILTIYPRSLKYNTTKSNPDHRCYELRKPLPKKFDFLFNFLSEQKYHPNQF
ncbi:hypothetical protein MJD09_21930 [bacterium]|nr:hypothetical protein [bacterium]